MQNTQETALSLFSLQFWIHFNCTTTKTIAFLPQILQVAAIDLDTGNNARLTYRLISANGVGITDSSAAIFGIFPNSGWIYLRGNLDREAADRYSLVVAATDNGTPSETATTRVSVTVLDANDNDPAFAREFYEFYVEENLSRGAVVGVVSATDRDAGANSAIRYSLIPGNTSFHIDSLNGKSVTTYVSVFCNVCVTDTGKSVVRSRGIIVLR